MGAGPFERARFHVREEFPVVAPSPSFPTLLTERLRLRPVRQEDASALFGVLGDPEAMRFWDAPARRTVAETAQLLRGYSAQMPARCPSWAIAYRDETRPVGVIALRVSDPESRGADVKFILGRNHWRQGLMSEALRRVLDHVFMDLALNRVQACRHVDDERTSSLLHRLSFHREGTMRQSLFVDGRYRDIDLHSLLAGDWLDARSAHRVALAAGGRSERQEAEGESERG